MAAASGFAVRLIVDGVDDEVKEKTVIGLAAGEDAAITFDEVRFRRGGRTIEATVDSRKVVAESDESNNEMKISVSCRDN
jgi:subtilase family serine protease